MPSRKPASSSASASSSTKNCTQSSLSLPLCARSATLPMEPQTTSTDDLSRRRLRLQVDPTHEQRGGERRLGEEAGKLHDTLVHLLRQVFRRLEDEREGRAPTT